MGLRTLQVFTDGEKMEHSAPPDTQKDKYIM